MDPLTLLIVDDEPLARQRVRRLLAQEPGVEIVGECANGVEAARAVAERRPDVLLLDVRMPRLDGLSLLRSLPPDEAPAVIFVTAHDEHAMDAFDVEALDFVRKPVEPERLRLAVARARRRRDTAQVVARHAKLRRFLETEVAPAPMIDRGPDATTASRSKRILVKERDRRFFVNADDVDWLEAYGNYVRLHVGGRVHLVRGTMARLAESLDGDQFVRIHRSSIVNLSRVKEMQPWFTGEYVVLLRDGTRLRMGRAYRADFERRSIV